MRTSALDPYADEILARARQGYSQRMLQIFLHHTKSLAISQGQLSRWLARYAVWLSAPVPHDGEYLRYVELARLARPRRLYRKKLARWRGHIEHLRLRGSSIAAIQADLKLRGIETSSRSIRRELQG